MAKYRINETRIPGVKVLKPTVYQDSRGFFAELFNIDEFRSLIGEPVQFVQDNFSFSVEGVLRGLHYQDPRPQGKLVMVLSGSIWDVAVDINKESNTFGSWVGVNLSSEDLSALWVPPGLAHGFIVTSKTAQVFYKVTDYYFPNYERTIAWNDTDLNIEWPEDVVPVLSAKDQHGDRFRDI